MAAAEATTGSSEAAEQHAGVVQHRGVQRVGDRHHHRRPVSAQGEDAGLLGEVDGHRPGELDVDLLDADARGEGEVELGRQRASDILLADGLALDEELSDAPAFLGTLRPERLGEHGRVELRQGHQNFAQGASRVTTLGWSGTGASRGWTGHRAWLLLGRGGGGWTIERSYGGACGSGTGAVVAGAAGAGGAGAAGGSVLAAAEEWRSSQAAWTGVFGGTASGGE